MAVETTIDNLITTLSSLSVYYRDEATALIQQADAALYGTPPPTVTELDYNPIRKTLRIDRPYLPPPLEDLPRLVVPDRDELDLIGSINEHFEGEAPELAIPSFEYVKPDDPREFSVAPPAKVELQIIPTVPSLPDEHTPELTPPIDIHESPIGGSPPQLPLPNIHEFEGDFHGEYAKAVELIGPELGEWSQWLKELREGLAPVEQQLTARLNAILQGSEPGLPDTWETQKYQAAVQAIHADRYQALDGLDSQPSSVTGLPTGASVYARLQVELKTMQATLQAAQQVSSERTDREVKHLQWALVLVQGLVDEALNLKAQEIGWRMKAVMLALEGAEGALDLAIRVLEFKEKELAYIVRYNDGQVRRTDDYLKVELSKLEVLKLDLANNQLRVTYNENNLQAYRIVQTLIETRAKLYSKQLEYIKTDLDWRTLDVDAYRASIQAYEAQVQAYKSQQTMLKAEIKKDQALVDGELAKIKNYEAKFEAFTAKSQASFAKAQAQALGNKQALSAYMDEVETRLQELRLLDNNVQLAVRAIQAQYETEFADVENQLQKQALEDQEVLQKSQQEFRYEHTAILKELYKYASNLNQLEAQGRVITQGAGVLGGIATQAFSSLNGVGTREIVENA